MNNLIAFHGGNHTHTHRTTVSGTSLSIPNTVNDSADHFEIGGKSVQQQTVQGENCIDIAKTVGNAGTTAAVEGGTLTVTGKYFVVCPVRLKPNTAYHLSYIKTVLSGIYNIVALFNQTMATRIAFGNASFGFTTGADTQYNLVFYANSGADGGQVKFADVMLHEGSSAQPYAPFVPNRPSTDYPSPVQSAGGFHLSSGAAVHIPHTLRSLPDGTYDTRISDRAAASAWIDRRVGEVTLSGTETWKMGGMASYDGAFTTSRYLFNSDLIGEHYVENEYCNRSKHAASCWTNDAEGYCINGQQLHLRLSNDAIGVTASDTSAERTVKFAAYLKAQHGAGIPYVVQGKLFAPLKEPVDYFDLPTAQYQTNITTDSPLQPNLRAEVKVLGVDGKYGVAFAGAANTGATVTRLDDAARLVAGVGTDTAAAVNDFDNVYPWSARRRCCGAFDADGNFIVNAYKGEPGYAQDGTNGEVWVEHSLFYYKHIVGENDSEEISISAFPEDGYLPAPIFIHSDGSLHSKAYTAAYPMATVDGKATSRSGVFSDSCSLNSAMTTARTLGNNYTTTTTAEWYTDCLYMWVEFATRNLQSVMNGACNMSYVATDTAAVAETAANRMIVTTAVANKFVVGQTIGIGTLLGSTNIANNRIVTAVQEYDADNKAILFDGNPVNIAVGDIVWSSAWRNGSCDGVLASSGSPVSNTNGKHNCMYRGKETPYGNAFEWISDVLFNRNGEGTTETPYTYDVHYLPDATKYSAGAITTDYVKLNFQLPTANGYVQKLGFDSRYPYLRLPVSIGAGTTTYYSDCYYYPTNAVCVAAVNGYWSNNVISGPCCWNCNYAPLYISVYRRARLSFHS